MGEKPMERDGPPLPAEVQREVPELLSMARSKKELLANAGRLGFLPDEAIPTSISQDARR